MFSPVFRRQLYTKPERQKPDHINPFWSNQYCKKHTVFPNQYNLPQPVSHWCSGRIWFDHSPGTLSAHLASVQPRTERTNKTKEWETVTSIWLPVQRWHTHSKTQLFYFPLLHSIYPVASFRKSVTYKYKIATESKWIVAMFPAINWQSDFTLSKHRFDLLWLFDSRFSTTRFKKVKYHGLSGFPKLLQTLVNLKSYGNTCS